MNRALAGEGLPVSMLCDRCRRVDRDDAPVVPVTLMLGSVVGPIHEATIHLCPGCQGHAERGFDLLVSQLKIAQRPGLKGILHELATLDLGRRSGPGATAGDSGAPGDP